MNPWWAGVRNFLDSPVKESDNVRGPVVVAEVRECQTTLRLGELKNRSFKTGGFAIPNEAFSWLSRLVKNDLLMQIGICWKRYKNFGRITILIRLTRPARDMGSEDHLDRSDLHLAKSV